MTWRPDLSDGISLRIAPLDKQCSGGKVGRDRWPLLRLFTSQRHWALAVTVDNRICGGDNFPSNHTASKFSDLFICFPNLAGSIYIFLIQVTLHNDVQNLTSACHFRLWLVPFLPVFSPFTVQVGNRLLVSYKSSLSFKPFSNDLIVIRSLLFNGNNSWLSLNIRAWERLY